jgi:hypothetical protein
MDNSTLQSIRLLLGGCLVVFLGWTVKDLHGRPDGLLEFIAVGTLVGGGMLLLLESGWRVMSNNRGNSEFDSFYGWGMVLGVIAMYVALTWHALASDQLWIILSMVLGSWIYIFTVRNPFVAICDFD